VGAGPGDPDLLTLRAVQRLGEADVVLYDHLLDPQILRLAPPQASRICVGKRASRHTLPQADINQLLIDFARSGQRVVRLKGGDPLLFGRGGEEMLALAAAGIPCEVVPGISAALGAAAALGLPLTDRDHARAVPWSPVTVVRVKAPWTGHSTASRNKRWWFIWDWEKPPILPASCWPMAATRPRRWPSWKKPAAVRNAAYAASWTNCRN
jgi:uroporphyrin-III C-methyltransferase